MKNKDVMDALIILKEYCRSHKVELNIDTKGTLAIWAELDKCDITINSVSPSRIITATNSLQLCRKSGWKSV